VSWLRVAAYSAAAAPRRQGIVTHNPAFAVEADLDESSFTRF
jgi:methyl-accepting chemotaxis protein